MDLKGLEKIAEQANEGVTITIYQPDGEPYRGLDGEPATVTVVGSESKRMKQARRAQQRRMIQRARMNVGSLSPEDSEREALLQVAAGVIAWTGWDDGKKDLPCETEFLVSVLEHDHIFEQVNGAIQGHAAFFAKGSGS